MPGQSGRPLRVMRQLGGKTGRAVRHAATAVVVLLASLAPASSQGQSIPDRARLLAAIETYRGIGQKFAQSSGPLAGFMGFYSRGYRCEFHETTAERPPGLWEKTQYALWADDKYLYGMTLDASPAVFQFEYRFVRNVIGMDIYEMTRVDKLGAAAGINDTEWRLLGFGLPSVSDATRIGIRIPPDFMASPDVHAIGWMTTCGRGGEGSDAIINPLDPLGFSIRFLQKRVASTPAR
jgi:hypothetical protein